MTTLQTQRVLMADGHLKPLTELQIGDQLMGPDSQPRTIVALRTIEEEAYEIKPVKGPAFILGESQVIHVIRSSASDHAPTYSLFTKGYQAQTNHWKVMHMLYRRHVDFPMTQDPPLAPYFLGILLGDGYLRGTPSITTPDTELITYLFDAAEQLGLQVRTDQLLGNAANTYHFVGKKGRKSILTTHLRKLGVHGKLSAEKFIPFLYKTGSVETRSAILAGLLDTDGYMAHKTFEYSTASKQLAEDVAFVARSLGFLAYPKEKVVKGKVYYRFCLSGDFTALPLKVVRKTPGPRLQIKHALHTGFTVHPVGIQPCTHLILAGPDVRYLKDDFMVMEGAWA